MKCLRIDTQTSLETVGEIKDAFPVRPFSPSVRCDLRNFQTKKVTLIHSQKQLLNNAYPAKFRIALENKVRRANVDLILGDRVDTFPSPGTVGVTTRSGKELPDADLVVSGVLQCLV